MTDIVMAYIVMACIVMVYIVMACKAMVGIVMAAFSRVFRCGFFMPRSASSVIS